MSPEALIGMELGNSVIQRLLGQGTMGAVYLGFQVDCQVAIKVFLPASPLAGADHETFLQRLEQTIARCAVLDHPQIVKTLSHGRQEQLVYQVMPYYVGENLEALLKRSETLPFVQIQHYLEQLAAALDYAHARGILHGDIKASNILLTPAGNLLLSDFGLASLTIEKNFASTRRAVPGMLNAIAPEYVLSQTVDQRADLYALGAVLFQMVTGTPPFQGKSLGEVAMKHVKSAPPSPRALRPDLPQAAEQVMLRALAKRPADRYTHARDLVAAFRLALAAALVENTSTSVPALNILADLAGSNPPTPIPAKTAAPRTGGLFDPKWRAQASLPPSMPDMDVPPAAATDSHPAQPISGKNGAEPTVSSPLESLGVSFAQPPTANVPPDEQPTNPLPPVQGQEATWEQPGTQAYAYPLAQEPLSLVQFGPIPDSPGGSKRAGLLSMAKFQSSTSVLEQDARQGQGQAMLNQNNTTAQLPDIPASNTEELKKLQQSASATGESDALASIPHSSNNDGTGTIRLSESVKIVQVPVAGQPGHFMTGYLSTQTAESQLSSPARPLSTRLRVVSLILAIIVVATGSGIYLATRNHTNLAPNAQTTPNPQASAAAQASATANANIIVSDSLSQNSNQWPTGSLKWYTCAFEGNAYHITNHDKTRSAPVLLANRTVSGPFTYTLTMDQIKGDETKLNNLFGMMLYATEKNVPGKPQVDTFYAFEMQNTAGGQYEFWKYDSSKTTSSPWTQLWAKKFGKEFKQGSGPAHANTIKVIATGKMFTFIVNGKQVGTWKDHAFSSGSVGMLVNMDGSEVAFSDLLLTHS